MPRLGWPARKPFRCRRSGCSRGRSHPLRCLRFSRTCYPRGIFVPTCRSSAKRRRCLPCCAKWPGIRWGPSCCCHKGSRRSRRCTSPRHGPTWPTRFARSLLLPFSLRVIAPESPWPGLRTRPQLRFSILITRHHFFREVLRRPRTFSNPTSSGCTRSGSPPPTRRSSCARPPTAVCAQPKCSTSRRHTPVSSNASTATPARTDRWVD